MPILKSNYTNVPYFFSKAFVATVVPSLFNKVNGVAYKRERLELPDGDFLDLDWLKNNNNRAMILSHGLEGDSHRHYIKRFAKYFYAKGWDIIAWNYRSCSGNMNRLPKFYSYGGTEDLDLVVQYVSKLSYEQIVLAGFSMGGGLVTKYVGEKKAASNITHAIGFSVSCDLKNSVEEVEKVKHFFYKKVFVGKLKEKLKLKARSFNDFKSLKISSIKNFRDFHKLYSIPFHHFNNVADFYEQSSSKPYYSNISIPTLIVNALNDPILGDLCYPYREAKENPNLFLETPKYGGHLGFTIKGNEFSYMELRAEKFLKENC